MYAHTGHFRPLWRLAYHKLNFKMKNNGLLNGLRWSRDSGSVYYDKSQSDVLGRSGGGTLGRSQICDRTSFRIPCLNRERFMKVFFVSHILLEQRKVLWRFSSFRFLVVWFLLSFVFLLLCWRIGGYGIFSVLRSVFFRRVGGCAVLGGVLEVVFWFFWWC